MKKIFIAVLLGVFMIAFLPSAGLTHTEANPFVTDLIADGGSSTTAVDAGDVLVWNDATNLYVKYVATPGWCITATHLHVAITVDEIPQKNGNPIPGLFDYNDKFNCGDPIPTYQIALNGWDVGDLLFIAAHAEMWDMTSEANVTVVSSTTTGVIEVNGVTVSAKAVLANEPFSYPNCASYTPNDTSPSLWDQQIGTTAFNAFSATPAADWIWNTGHPENPRTGDVVTFQETFSVPGLPFNADLLITADNAFTAKLNGADVGSSISLGPGFPGTLREQMISVPQDGNWGVASQGWQKVELFPLGGIASGDNTLTIIAANEYMCDGTDNCGILDRYYGWNNTSKAYTSAINNDPLPGDGAGVQPCYNPGALIFKASIDYYDRSETGWGDGTEFVGRNWATYIEYTVQDLASPSPECTGATCFTFIPCDPAGGCTDPVCTTTAEGGGVCVEGTTPCAGLASCSSSSECAGGGLCVVNTCCGAAGVCVPPETWCVNIPEAATEALQSTDVGPTIGGK